MNTEKMLKPVVNIIMGLVSLSCIFPMIWIGYSSLKSDKEFSRSLISLPEELQFMNYVDAFNGSNMGLYSLNSFFNAVVSVCLVLIIAFVTAYFLARFHFRGNRLIYMLYLFGMLVPVHALMVPIFVQFKNLGLFNMRLTLIFPYVAFGLPFALFLTESFIRTIPVELDEAAVMEGAGLLRTMFQIILPCAKPILISVGVLQFFGNWNEYPFALTLINKHELKTIALGLMNFKGEFSTNYTVQMAGIVMATIPVILLYIGFNQKIIQGMTEGSVKG
jgi:raffinose/stachyose/melibiose transport system permease protein